MTDLSTGDDGEEEEDDEEEWAQNAGIQIFEPGNWYFDGDLEAEEENEEEWAQNAAVQIFEPGNLHFDGMVEEAEGIRDHIVSNHEATEQEEHADNGIGAWQLQTDELRAEIDALMTQMVNSDMMADFLDQEFEPVEARNNNAELRCVICRAVWDPATCPCDGSTAHT